MLRSLQRQAQIQGSRLSGTAPPNGEDVGDRAKGSRIRGLFTRGEEGGALIEMALTAPALLLLFTGLITFAMAYKNQIVLTQATGVAGQYLSQIRTTSTNPCSDVFTALKNAAPGLNSANITVSVTMNGTTPTQTGNTCSGSQTDLVQGSPVTVYATYPCTLSIYSVGGFQLGSSCQLQAKVTEYEY
jgi:Flp pilus assembly protein TadG